MQSFKLFSEKISAKAKNAAQSAKHKVDKLMYREVEVEVDKNGKPVGEPKPVVVPKAAPKAEVKVHPSKLTEAQIEEQKQREKANRERLKLQYGSSKTQPKFNLKKEANLLALKAEGAVLGVSLAVDKEVSAAVESIRQNQKR